MTIKEGSDSDVKGEMENGARSEIRTHASVRTAAAC